MVRAGQTASKIKRDDTVAIVKGKDRGKTGRVLKVDHGKQRVIIEGLNIMKKAIKPKKQNDKGGIKELEKPMALSNVMIVCKKCGPTRAGFKVNEKEKIRICKKCGEKV